MTTGGESSKPSNLLYRDRDLTEIAARWDAKARQWDHDLLDPHCHLNEDQSYQRFLNQLNREVQSRAKFCAAQGVIDAGCATGLVLESVLDSFAWGIGLDISPQMIQAARAKKINRAKFTVGDCFKLPSLCPKAGAVFSRGVLLSHYGAQNAPDLLQASHAVLVPNGFICFDFLNETGRAGAKHAPGNKTYFTAESVRDLALAAGFTKVETVAEPGRRVGFLVAERA